MLGGSDEKELYLLYNIPTSKKQSYVRVDVPFNYVPGYADSYITFTKRDIIALVVLEEKRNVYKLCWELIRQIHQMALNILIFRRV